MKKHWFQILLALADEKRHGLAIMNQVLDQTEGRMKLWPGMLYGALRDLEEKKWLAEVPTPDNHDAAGGKPRFFELTALGRGALQDELRHLRRLLVIAESRHLLEGGGE